MINTYQVTKISQLKTARQLGFLAKDGLSDSALLVIQLCKKLPEPLNYTLFCDNFFTSTKLFKALRSLGIAACGTAKKGSGFPAKLLALRDVAIKSKHWGLRASTTVDEVLCLGWVDNNTVQLMTRTIYIRLKRMEFQKTPFSQSYPYHTIPQCTLTSFCCLIKHLHGL